MSIVSAIAIYFIIWWVTLFVVLPFRVRSQHETGEVVEGSEAGAPEHPHLWWKLGITSLVALVEFALVYWLLVYQPIALGDLPFIGQV